MNGTGDGVRGQGDFHEWDTAEKNQPRSRPGLIRATLNQAESTEAAGHFSRRVGA